jgi:hypothetical protein
MPSPTPHRPGPSASWKPALHQRYFVILGLTFRTLYRTFEAILEEPPAETGGGAIYRLFHTSQPIVATSFSP